MRVLMTGGGTGGHVNPAIAIADYIKSNQPDSEIAFVGTAHGIENRLVPKAGYKLYHVNVKGFSRKLSVENIGAAVLAVTSPIAARKLIKSFSPDIVIGTGGYASWPVLRAAAEMNIPTAVHEANAVPGVTVKMLSKYVDRVYVNFKETAERLDESVAGKIICVGNPMRNDLSGFDRREIRKKLGIEGKYKYFILSCGGSMGAQMVNEAVLAMMRDFTSKHPEILHIHGTGAIEYEDATAMYKNYGLEKAENCKLLEYIYDMPQQMAAADIVISRAGSMTLSELAIQNKCCILIPSPNVTENHQFRNASVLSDAGAAVLIEEKELSGGKLDRTVAGLLEAPEKMDEMTRNIRQFAVTNANERIYRDILTLIEDKNK